MSEDTEAMRKQDCKQNASGLQTGLQTGFSCDSLLDGDYTPETTEDWSDILSQTDMKRMNMKNETYEGLMKRYIILSRENTRRARMAEYVHGPRSQRTSEAYRIARSRERMLMTALKNDCRRYQVFPV